MCAIIGLFGKEIDISAFERARDTMRSRGPDDAGIFSDAGGRITLGSRRLSIIDLSSAGHQPMHSADGRFIIVFNGEIFNYVELKKELPGYQFRSESDTEVLLASYAMWGAACLPKLNGQFAFAIYDTREKTLFCARDHLGVKPFFYSLEGRAFAFASEIKALLAMGAKARPNHAIIAQYLETGYYDHTDETFFEGIRSLPPGHMLHAANGAVRIEKYWDLADCDIEPSSRLSASDAEERLHELIADSIRLQFRSDVPVGLNLTSGLDSGTLYYFSKKIYPAELHMFTGGVADERYDERPTIRARLSKEEQKFWHTSELRPENVFPLAEELMKIEDQPYGGMPAIQFFNLYRETEHQTKARVVIEGQGMDEILAGYKYYRPSFYQDALRRGSFAVFRDYFSSERENGKGYGDALRSFRNLLFSPSGLSQDMTKESGFNIADSEYIKRWGGTAFDFPRPFSERLLNDQYRDLRFTKLPRILRSNDHFSMAFSREVRVPYLDHRLVEFAMGLAPRLKIRGDHQKYLLRKAMAPYLPEAMDRAPKVAFGAFQTLWFRNHFRDTVVELIGSRSFRERPCFNHRSLEQEIGRFFAGEGSNSFFLWQVVNLELWFRNFID